MIIVIGLSHKTAPLEIREKFALGSEATPLVLSKLASRPEIEECMFLSTCNRVEIILKAKMRSNDERDTSAASQAARRVLAEAAGLQEPERMDAYFYEHQGDGALLHILRVASSLDSMVLGEPQILGQFKSAYELARSAGTVPGTLGRFLPRVIATAKRVRTETQIGAGAVSISSVAVELAKSIFGTLEQHTVLLVGAGEMAEAAAKALGKSSRSIRVCNRSLERAAELAQSFGGAASSLESLEQELVLADVVVTSTGATHYIVTKELVKRVMRARRGRTLFFVDIAVPRNVEPKVHGVDNVYVFNVDDLEKQVALGMTGRRAVVDQAEALIRKELTEFQAWAASLELQPLIVSFRARTHGVLRAELERMLSTKLKHLTDGDRALLEQLIEGAANKLLHTPTSKIRESAGTEDGVMLTQALLRLFDLQVESEETVDDEDPRLAESREVRH